MLNRTWNDIIKEINKKFKDGYIAVRKRKSNEKIWEIWGQYMFDMKIEIEQVLRQYNDIPHLGWLYAYLQNRNQLINLNMETRVGNMKLKKSMETSAKLLLSLIAGEKTVAGDVNKDGINKKVQEHLNQLYFGKRFDTIAGRKILVSDYPKEKIPEEPKTILAPRDLQVEIKD